MNSKTLLASTLAMTGLEVSDLKKVYKPIDHAKQNTWYRKTFQRPQKSRHNRTKGGRKK